MTTEPSILSFIIHSSIIVKLVLLTLVAASISSWTIIFQRSKLLKLVKKNMQSFEQQFWSGIDLHTLFNQMTEDNNDNSSLAKIFQSGFLEFTRLQKISGMDQTAVLEGTQRAMRIATNNELQALEKSLPFLATVGSTSPYIGLFGTVCGIMTSLQALGTAQQASIAMVAPGISEALIATAIGLFAAIPAVIFYNRLTNDLANIAQNFDTFQEEFYALLHRKIHST